MAQSKYLLVPKCSVPQILQKAMIIVQLKISRKRDSFFPSHPFCEQWFWSNQPLPNSSRHPEFGVWLQLWLNIWNCGSESSREMAKRHIPASKWIIYRHEGLASSFRQSSDSTHPDLSWPKSCNQTKNCGQVDLERQSNLSLSLSWWCCSASINFP